MLMICNFLRFCQHSQELKEYEHQKSEARADLAQLRSSVEKTKQSLALATDEHRIRQEALHKLRVEVEKRHLEVDDGQRHVDRVQADVEQEENRLSRVRDKNVGLYCHD